VGFFFFCPFDGDLYILTHRRKGNLVSAVWLL